MYMPETFLGMPMVNPWIYSMLLNGVLVLAVMAVDLAVIGVMQRIPALRRQVLASQRIGEPAQTDDRHKE